MLKFLLTQTIFCFSVDQKDINCIFELNLNKTQLLAIGKSALVTSDYLVESIKICVVIFKTAQSHKAIKANIMMCVENIKQQINFFNTVPCTNKGKVLIANTIWFPKIYFIAKTFLPGRFCLLWRKDLCINFCMVMVGENALDKIQIKVDLLFTISAPFVKQFFFRWVCACYSMKILITNEGTFLVSFFLFG